MASWQVVDGVFSFTSGPYDDSTFDLIAAYGTSNFSMLANQCFGSGDPAFASPWSNLGMITIPSGVSSIGALAFYRCDRLSTVLFESGSQLKSIGPNAFSRMFSHM